MITVEKIDQTTFQVTVKERTTTNHRVTVDPSYCEKLTGGSATPEVLIEKSFQFLLQREDNTSILSTFDLPVIGEYFPEYEGTIRKMFE